MAWIVHLTKKPEINDFRAGYFPRKFHHKKDALRLIEEVKRKGGDAEVKKQ